MPNFIDVMDKLEEMDNKLEKLYTALAIIFDKVDKESVERLRWQKNIIQQKQQNPKMFLRI